MAFEFAEEHLALMFSLANLDVPSGEMIFFGLRGCSPVDDSGTGFARSQKLEHLRVDFTHMNCTIGQWVPGTGIAVFPASTVPHINAVRSHIAAGGRGVNQLALGYYRDGNRYYKGEHKISNPSTRHRAFRNDSALPVWRTGDDADYEGDDFLGYEVVFDNMHCAWQLNVAASMYSSNGCQVIAGMPRVEARGWDIEKGPWKRFIAHAYDVPQSRFCYGLFAGHEAVKAATVSPEQRAQTVRFGSRGPLVKSVQEALMAQGYDIGAAGADGDCGFSTINAVKRFQLAKLGAQNADLIVGPATAEALGLDWSGASGASPVASLAASAAAAPAVAAEAAATAGGGTYNDKYKVTFRSLVAGGFYSHDPDDMSVKRAIRTNNPGALNITGWQKTFPGYVGITPPDSAGNKTTIYVTPEHGVGAWFHLLSQRYGYGATGSLRIGDLARRYSGTSSETSAASRAYVAGWKRGSGGALNAGSVIDLGDDSGVLMLAKAMFFHEIGSASPLKDVQIVEGVTRERQNTFPA
jgi:peptidoglycan hydrolase-like protein with peptidoglycan-binding domain